MFQVSADSGSRFQPEGAAAGVPDAEPRISTPAAAPPSQRMAVQPVSASKSETCPTRIPGMSVNPFMQS